jgi:osmotically-inducible protein OsmY
VPNRDETSRRSVATISPHDAHERRDSDIEQDAAHMIRSITIVPSTVHVDVMDGIVTLTGRVDWMYQKEAADNAVTHLSGVRGVSNRIAVNPRLPATSAKAHIEDTLRRSAIVDARRISVETCDGLISLSGIVHSCWGSC